MAGISEELLSRVRARAMDTQRRTYLSGAEANAQTLGGILGNLQSMFGGIKVVAPLDAAPSSETIALAPPPSDQEWDEAASMIGAPLPDALRQIYAIGNGGFGPGGGLLPIADVAADYRGRRDRPFGPDGQDWPEGLIVLTDPNDVHLCLDLASGEVVAWEPDRIEDEASEAEWKASFVKEAGSLSVWLEDWLGEETFDEMRARVQRETEEKIAAQKASPVTGDKMPYDDPEQQVAAEILLLETAPELRAIYGLPEEGWHEEVRRLHGLS